MGVLKSCTLRKEVLKGDLDDAIFAADFGDLVAGKAPGVYGDAVTFFNNTHPAKQLCKVVGTVFERLADRREGGATVRLSTGFGGGKSHTLMAMWHLAQNISDPAMGTDLLPAAGRPKSVTVAAVDASKAGSPIFASHAKTQIRSLWGELAYQLGGEKAVKKLGEADHPEHQPDETLLGSLFPSGPVLLLLDELVVYMATLSERGQGNLLALLNKLAAVVGKRPQTVLVVTDPADQRTYARESAKVGDALTAAAVKLDDMFGRKMTDFDPIGEEAAQVINRRLFQKIDPAAAQAASASYHALYERVVRENPGTVPPAATTSEYAKRIVDCYPFHPRLLDTAQGRLGALQEFNKSRGTLRLFARILRTVWEARQDLELISAGDLDWASDRIQADLLQRLNRDSFKAAVSADILGHAREMDSGAPGGIHVRVGSALLLESIPMQSNSGLEPADLALAVLRPDEAGPEPAEALARLVGVCWHTYPLPGGRGWQFRYEPNVIKQIEERMTDIPIEDARSRVLGEVQGYFSGPFFKVSAWPASARQVQETADLQLVLAEEERVARTVCGFVDDAEPGAPVPRRFQNAILAVTTSGSAYNAAVERAQRLLAAEAIEREHKAGEANKLVREQLRRIMPELQKQFQFQTCRAFDRVVLTGGIAYTLDEQFLVSEQEMLKKPQGQSLLRRFLDEKGLLYQPSDALDTARFVKEILPGATPVAGNPEVFTTKAVNERFLSAPGLRLIPDGGVVRQTILKSVAEGRTVVRLADGRTYDAQGCVEGQEGKRRRIPGSLTSIPLDDTVLVTPVASASGKLWVKEDGLGDGGGKGGDVDHPRPHPLPPPVSRVTATTWEKLLEVAKERPLLELKLTAVSPPVAANLGNLAQPLGADSLSLNVTVSGALREGGNLNFAAQSLKHNHQTKPLEIARTLCTAIGKEAEYEAQLAMGFGDHGRTGMEAQLRSLAESAPEGVTPWALFEKPPGKGK